MKELAALALAALACACAGSAPPPCPEPEAPTPAPSAAAGKVDGARIGATAPFRGAYVAERLVHEGQAISAREVFLGDRHPQCFHFRWLWIFDETRLAVRLETLCEVGSTEDGKRTDYVSCVAELSTDVVWEAPDRLRIPHSVAARGEVAQLSRRKTGGADAELGEDKQNCSVSIDAALWTVSDVSGEANDGQPAAFALTNDTGARWEVTASLPTFDRQATIEAHVAAPSPPSPPR